jgi:hypothetical protein
LETGKMREAAEDTESQGWQTGQGLAEAEIE